MFFVSRTADDYIGLCNHMLLSVICPNFELVLKPCPGKSFCGYSLLCGLFVAAIPHYLFSLSIIVLCLYASISIDEDMHGHIWLRIWIRFCIGHWRWLDGNIHSIYG